VYEDILRHVMDAQSKAQFVFDHDARVAAPACKLVPVRHDARSRMDHLVAHIVFDALIVGCGFLPLAVNTSDRTDPIV
jgi:hypothetical protein